MKKVLIAAMLFAGSWAFAQQDVQFSQYMFNRILYNPAVAGSSGSICANALMRSQWVGFGDGNPQSLNVNVHMPVRFLGGGLGLSIMSDELGFQYTRDFRLSYSYHLDLGSGQLGIGISGGLSNVGLQVDQWIDPAGGSGGLDPSIPAVSQNEIVPDLGFGLYYWNDQFWAGASVSHLVPFSADYANNFGNTLKFDQSRHIFVNAGYRWEMSPNWELRPSMLVKSDLASFQLDINGVAYYNNKFYGGLSYRIEDAVAVLLGMNVMENLTVGYSYDVTTSQLNVRSNGSHEVMLKYCFEIEVPPRTPQKYRNVRFL